MTDDDELVDSTDGATDDVLAAAAAAAAAGDDDSESNCVALLHNTCRRPVPTLVLANGDISCDVTLLKEVSLSHRRKKRSENIKKRQKRDKIKKTFVNVV